MHGAETDNMAGAQWLRPESDTRLLVWYRSNVGQTTEMRTLVHWPPSLLPRLAMGFCAISNRYQSWQPIEPALATRGVSSRLYCGRGYPC